jgi:hypothetical protein
MDKLELIKFVNNPKHNLVKEQEVSGVKVTISFKPGALMVAQELTSLSKKDTQTINSLDKKYSNSYYFLLKYAKDNKELIRQLGSFDRYSSMLQVLSFKMQGYINLTTPAKDTIPLGDYLFEQNYGMGEGNTILLVFDKERLTTTDIIEINVAECGFGIGNLKFRFKKGNLDNVPKLDYTKID